MNDSILTLNYQDSRADLGQCQGCQVDPIEKNTTHRDFNNYTGVTSENRKVIIPTNNLGKVMHHAYLKKKEKKKLFDNIYRVFKDV